MKTKILFIVLAVLFVGSANAGVISPPEVDVQDPSSLVAYLTPFVVLAATWLVRLVKPGIPGWATMIVVLLLSSATTYVTNLLSSPDVSPLIQILLGLGATFLHQFKQQFTSQE